MEIKYGQQVGFINGSGRSVVRYLGRLRMHDVKMTDKIAKNNGVWKNDGLKKTQLINFLVTLS